MKPGRSTLKWISLVLFAASLYACSPYLAREIPKEPLPAFDGKVVNLFWPGQDSLELRLTGVRVENNAISGSADAYKEANPYNYGNQWINVYVSDLVIRPEILPCDMSFDISQIRKIEVYNPSTMKVIGNIALVSSTELMIMVLTFAIIAALKESCPFVYAWNGEDYALAGETYSGAIFPFQERHDYLPLPALKPERGEYKIRLTNEVKEVQYTNLAELIVVDHPVGTSLLLDKYGCCLSYSDPQPPVWARTANGNNLAGVLKAKDELRYGGEELSSSESGMDAITLSFKRAPHAKSATLLLRAKSSFWLDYTLMKWFDLFGSKYNSWYRRQSGKPGTINPNWAVEQGIQLSVYLKKQDAWEFVDYFTVTGPMAERDMAMSIDLSSLENDDVTLKLINGFMFWEFDYAAMDFSPPCEVKSQALPIRTATDQRGKNVRPLLAWDDRKYQTLARIGDQVSMSFDAPSQDANTQRTVFLHGKGHYRILRDPSGEPNFGYLKQFRAPGRLSQFSREKYLELMLQASSKGGHH